MAKKKDKPKHTDQNTDYDFLVEEGSEVLFGVQPLIQCYHRDVLHQEIKTKIKTTFVRSSMNFLECNLWIQQYQYGLKFIDFSKKK